MLSPHRRIYRHSPQSGLEKVVCMCCWFCVRTEVGSLERIWKMLTCPTILQKHNVNLLITKKSLNVSSYPEIDPDLNRCIIFAAELRRPWAIILSIFPLITAVGGVAGIFCWKWCCCGDGGDRYPPPPEKLAPVAIFQMNFQKYVFSMNEQ